MCNKEKNRLLDKLINYGLLLYLTNWQIIEEHAIVSEASRAESC